MLQSLANSVASAGNQWLCCFMEGLQVALCQHCKREPFFCLCLPAACSLPGLCSPGGAAATCLPGACLLLGTPPPSSPPPTSSLLQPANLNWASLVINILLKVRPWPKNTRDQGQFCSLSSPMDLFHASRHAWTQISWKTFLESIDINSDHHEQSACTAYCCVFTWLAWHWLMKIQIIAFRLMFMLSVLISILQTWI